VSPDASVYTFKLRKDVTFHDGSKFDATAVKRTYDHVVDPPRSPRAGWARSGPTSGPRHRPVHRGDQLHRANASFLHQQAAGNFGIASGEALTRYGAPDSATTRSAPARFKFESYATGDRLTLVKNPGYTWGPAVLGSGFGDARQAGVPHVADSAGRYNALQSGQLQIGMKLLPNNIDAARKSGKFTQLDRALDRHPARPSDQRHQSRPPTTRWFARHHLRRRPGEVGQGRGSSTSTSPRTTC